MPRRKLPLLTERSLAQMKAERLGLGDDLASKMPPVTCKIGCAACCSYPIYISILEGMLLYRQLTERGHWTPSLRKKLEAHADKTFDLAPEVWLLLDMPCPLLDKDKKCLAYASRPFTCRTIYARSDPKLCHPHRMTSAVFVDRTDVTRRFREVEAKILGRHKLGVVGLPISKAILIGEKIMIGEADLEQFLVVALESIREATP